MSIAIVKAALAADIPVIVWGPPGVGKTAAIRALAREQDAHVEVLIGSTMDPIDVGGWAVPHDGIVEVSPPAWARRAKHALETKRPAWIFLDEISCAPPSVQAALLRVIHERKVAEVDLAGCRMIAASNRTEHAADGGTLAAAASNRWAHCEWQLDVGEWCVGELSGWGTPRTAAESRAAANVAGFVRRHPARLLSLPKGEEVSRPWPSPRSWSAAIRMMANSAANDVIPVVGSCIGSAAASEFATYIATLDLPDPEALLAGKAKLPTRGDSIYAATAALVAVALSTHKNRSDRVVAAWSILGSQRPDIVLSAAKTLAVGAPDIVTEETVKLGARIRSAS